MPCYGDALAFRNQSFVMMYYANQNKWEKYNIIIKIRIRNPKTFERQTNELIQSQILQVIRRRKSKKGRQYNGQGIKFKVKGKKDKFNQGIKFNNRFIFWINLSLD